MKKALFRKKKSEWQKYDRAYNKEVNKLENL